MLTSLILKLLELHGVLDEHARLITRPVGQTPVRWKVLGGAEESPRTVSQIARRMGVDRQGVQRVADALVKEGLIRLEKNPDHRRSPKLLLTPEGQATFDKITCRQMKWVNELARHLPMNDVVRATRTLQRFQDALAGVHPAVFKN